MTCFDAVSLDGTGGVITPIEYNMDSQSLAVDIDVDLFSKNHPSVAGLTELLNKIPRRK